MSLRPPAMCSTRRTGADKRVSTGVAAAAALTLTLGACSAGSSTSGASGSATDQKLVVGLVAEPASLDFTKSDGAAIPQALLKNVYENLVTLDQEGKIVPQLAKSWEVSPDRLTYTFTLVEGATFSNGDTFDASDAVFSINRVKKEWTPSVKTAMDVVKEAKATNPTTLTVTLAQPSNDWLFRMTTRVGAMFSESGVSALATDPVGTGPYDLAAWNKGDSISLKTRGDYWGDKPAFSEVTLRYFKDATSLNNAMLTQAIDVIGTVQAPESLGQFSDTSKFQVVEGTTNGEVVLGMNNSSALLKDVRVRQAIRHAIDKRALVDTCWAGKGELIGSHVPPTDPWYEDLTGLVPFDRAKSKQLLTAAGKPNPALRLRIPNLPYAVSCGQVVKSQLEQAGFKVTLDTLEFPAAWLTTVFTNADYDLSIVAHVEPRDISNMFGNPQYYLRYNNPQVQALLKKADTGTEDEQVTAMKEVARTISQDAASDWLFLMPNLMVADPDIKGLPKNAIGEYFDLKTLSRG